MSLGQSSAFDQTDRKDLRDLNSLLQHLESNLSSSQVDHDLRRSSVQRSKIGFSIEHARSLLLRLGGERNRPQTGAARSIPDLPDLRQQRESLKRLEEHLFELEQHQDAGHTEEDGSETDSDMDEFLERYAPAVKDASSGLDIDANHPAMTEASRQTTMQAAASLGSALRARRTLQEDARSATGTATGRAAGYQTSVRDAATPFAQSTASEPQSQNDNLLSYHSGEQEDLSSALLSLATALKQSTVSFSETLTASNPMVDETTSALGKSTGGMEAAQKRMGMLRRMTEGKGKLGRIILYGWIAGLWVVLILIMFVMPKLRF